MPLLWHLSYPIRSPPRRQSSMGCACAYWLRAKTMRYTRCRSSLDDTPCTADSKDLWFGERTAGLFCNGPRPSSVIRTAWHASSTPARKKTQPGGSSWKEGGRWRLTHENNRGNRRNALSYMTRTFFGHARHKGDGDVSWFHRYYLFFYYPDYTWWQSV